MTRVSVVATSRRCTGKGAWTRECGGAGTRTPGVWKDKNSVMGAACEPEPANGLASNVHAGFLLGARTEAPR